MTNPLTPADIDAIQAYLAKFDKYRVIVDGPVSTEGADAWEAANSMAVMLAIDARTLLDHAAQQQARIDTLESALNFYASDNTYINWGSTDPSYLNPSKITSDRGQLARKALKGE